jgi:hypothetical protein
LRATVEHRGERVEKIGGRFSQQRPEVKEHDPDGGNDAKSREGLDFSAAHNNLSVRPQVNSSTTASLKTALAGYQCARSIASRHAVRRGANALAGDVSTITQQSGSDDSRRVLRRLASAINS